MCNLFKTCPLRVLVQRSGESGIILIGRIFLVNFSLSQWCIPLTQWAVTVLALILQWSLSYPHRTKPCYRLRWSFCSLAFSSLVGCKLEWHGSVEHKGLCCIRPSFMFMYMHSSFLAWVKTLCFRFQKNHAAQNVRWQFKGQWMPPGRLCNAHGQVEPVNMSPAKIV